MKDKLMKYLQKEENKEALKRMVDWEKELEAKKEREAKGRQIDFDWKEVRVKPQLLNKLYLEGILDITYSSGKHTYYRLKNRRLVEELLKEKEIVEDVESEKPSLKAEKKLPEDLFLPIEGYDDIKELFNMSVKAEKPVHILLVGPPASAKTLFLLELSRLPEAFYVLGGSTTKAGLFDQLFSLKPRYVLIDEFEKMNVRDYSCLLSLCETGIVKETKYKKTREAHLNSKVYGAANTIKKIPPEIRSRFMELKVPEYNTETFVSVGAEVLKKREGVSEDMAEFIMKECTKLRSMDIRNPVRVSRIAESKDEVKKIVRIMKKYERKSKFYNTTLI